MTGAQVSSAGRTTPRVEARDNSYCILTEKGYSLLMANANNTAYTTATHFVPSSSMLNDMIARAMVACDADIEQVALRKVAEEERTMERVILHETEVRARRRRWGI